MTDVASISQCARSTDHKLPIDLLGSIVERSRTPVVVYHNSDGPVYLNQSARRLWPDVPPLTGEMCVLLDGESRRLSTLIPRADGNAGPTGSQLVRLPDGRECGVDAYLWQGGSAEETWQVIAFRPLRRTLSELESFQDKIDRLVAIAHDMRNTVTASTEALTLVDEGPLGDLNADQHRLVRSAIEDQEHMTRMLADLTSLWTTQASVFRVSMAPIRLQDIVEQAGLYASMVVEKAGVSLCIEAGAALPPIVGDHDLLVQAVRNMLNYTAQFTPSGGEVRVRAFLSRTTPRSRLGETPGDQDGSCNTGQSIIVEVKSSGEGLPNRGHAHDLAASTLGSAWMKEARRNVASGAELGLEIAREIAWTHGGTLRVSTEPDRGARLKIPLSRAGSEQSSECVVRRAIDEASNFDSPMAAVLLRLECDEGEQNDLLFATVQHTAMANLRPTDTVLATNHRLLILMRGGTRSVATTVVDRILSALIEISERHTAMFGSDRVRYGVAAFPEDADTAGGLLKCAEAQLREIVIAERVIETES